MNSLDRPFLRKILVKNECWSQKTSNPGTQQEGRAEDFPIPYRKRELQIEIGRKRFVCWHPEQLLIIQMDNDFFFIIFIQLNNFFPETLRRVVIAIEFLWSFLFGFCRVILMRRHEDRKMSGMCRACDSCDLKIPFLLLQPSVDIKKKNVYFFIFNDYRRRFLSNSTEFYCCDSNEKSFIRVKIVCASRFIKYSLWWSQFQSFLFFLIFKSEDEKSFFE
jgi:hypothetical protein